MKAVITVTGKDTVGIIADVSAVCAAHGANIREITQNVLDEYFAMIMIASLDGLKIPFADAKQILTENRSLLDEISEFLLVKETITGDELMAFINKEE